MAECASVLHRVPTWWPGKREAEFLEGKAYLEAGHAHDAERAWLAALRDDPLHPTPPQYRRAAVEGLLDLYALEERRPEAIALVWAEYEQAQAEDRPNILIMRFRLEFDRIAPDVALKPLRRYVEADPTDLDARLALARAVGADGKPVEADRLIRGALRTNPSDPTVHRTRIALLGARNDLGALRKAIAELPQSLAVTDDPAIQEARGRVLQADGRLDAAADAYLAALKRRPDDPDFVYRLGIVERTRGRTAEARRLLARSQALRAARTAMKDAYKAYVDATEPGSSAPISVGETAARLARHCRTLGLRREADALSRLHPTADNENGRPSDEGRPPG